MSEKPLKLRVPPEHTAATLDQRRQDALLKAEALQNAIANSANFSSIATDEKGLIQLFNVGAEHMLGYAATEVVNQCTPADISDPQDLIVRAIALGIELATPITAGFEALVCKASRGIEDIYELTYIRKDGSRFPALVSVTALRNEHDATIGYLLISTDKYLAQASLLKARGELERLRADEALRVSEERYRSLFESIDDGFCIIEKVVDDAAKPMDFRYIEANPAFVGQTGVSDVVGKTIRQVVPSESEEWFLTYDTALETGEPIRFEHRLLTQKRVLEFHVFRIEDPTRRRVGVSFKDITSRTQAEEHLRESEAFNRSIIKSSPDCIKVLDLEGNLLSMESGQELLGIEDIRPFLNTSWIAFWEDEHRQAAQAAVKSAAAGEARKFVGFFRTFRGEPKWWDVAVSPILDAKGKPVRLLAVSRDVTERRQAEMNLEFLASVSQDLARWTNMREMMRTVGAKMAAYLQLSQCALAEINDAAEQVVINYGWHREDAPSMVGVYRLADFVGEEFIRVARAGEVIVVRNAATDPRTDPEKFATLKIASFVCVPLILEGQWRFALCLYHSLAYNWREDEIELMRELTARIWARLERVRAEVALRASEQKYRTLFESIDEGFFIIQKVASEAGEPLDFRYIEANPGFAAQTGVSGVVGKTIRQLFPDESEEWFLTYDAVLRTGESIRFERGLVAQRRVLELYAFRVEDETHRGVAVIFKDITERKKAEERLHESVRELRAAEFELRSTEVELSKEKAALDDHVLQLVQANQHLTIATKEAHTLAEEIDQARIHMVYLAQHDALTNLPNRILLNDRLTQAIALARRQGKQLSVMFLDLDRFKHINDSLGHAVGDQLLQSVAKRLTAVVRSSDTVCRQGGDEFVILLADVDHAEHAALSAQKILDSLSAPHRIDQLELHVTVSIGISIYPDDGQDGDTLIKSADTAMYHAKEGGRNNCQFFEPEMNVLAVERHSIEVGLSLALERQEFMLHYQPKINLQSGTISGVEALVRWQHPQHGQILPEKFVWIAEDCGLIVPIGAWVLREACRQAQSWQDEGLPPVPVAVNISAVQFRHKDFLQSLARILSDTGLAPRYLELELTESVLMHDAASTVRVLNALKAMGVRLAIDDFGTGYSSLSYLKRFPIDTLKIDQSFLRDITHATADSDDGAIVAAVVSMGRSLNQRVIAEGVETREQLAFLQAQGCGEGQGFYFSRPVTADALGKLLSGSVSQYSRLVSEVRTDTD